MPVPVAAIIGAVGCVLCCCLSGLAAAFAAEQQKYPNDTELKELAAMHGSGVDYNMYVAQQQRMAQLENYIQRRSITENERLMNPRVQVNVGTSSINVPGTAPAAQTANTTTPVGAVPVAGRPVGFTPAFTFQPCVPIVSPLGIPSQNAPFAGTPIHFMR